MHRKEFIKTCCVSFVGGAALSALMQSCAGTNYFAASTISGTQLVIRKTEFVKISKGKTVQRKYLLVKTTQFHYPICIYKINEGHYSSLLMECTHRSCELNPQGDFLVCPCHGSEFTKTGEVQNPPAERKLKSFKTTADNENIYIQL